MWRSGVWGLGALVACSTTAAVERRYLPNGSWQLTCELPMGACVRAFETNCPGKRYRILSGATRHQLRDVEPAVRETFTSELTAVCDPEGMKMNVDAPSAAAGLASGRSGSPPADGLASGRSGSPPAGGARVCLPGATQTCVGPAGCPGGQTCGADGAGFTPCDCGTPRSTGDAGP